jgi:hypothetical protein
MITLHLSEESKYLRHQSSRQFHDVYSGPGFSDPAPATMIEVYASGVFGGSFPAPGRSGRFSTMNITSRSALFGHVRTVDESGMFRYPISWNGSHGRLIPNPERGHLSVYDRRRELQSLLRKDIYCQPCLRAIAMEDLTAWRDYHKVRLQLPLYCSGCAMNHPTILFSICQRSKDDDQRICIGREGYVRICPHKTFSWSDVEDYVAYHPSGNYPRVPQVTTCYRCASNEQCGRYGGKLMVSHELHNFDQATFKQDTKVLHRIACDYCSALYEWVRSGDGVALQRPMLLYGGILKSPYGHNWTTTLDPSSYDIKEPRLRHTLWCDSPKCATTRHWREQRVLGAITKALLEKGQWGVPTPHVTVHAKQSTAYTTQ